MSALHGPTFEDRCLVCALPVRWHRDERNASVSCAQLLALINCALQPRATAAEQAHGHQDLPAQTAHYRHMSTLTLGQVCQVLQVSSETVRRWRHEGRIVLPRVREDGMRGARWNALEFFAWLDQRATVPVQPGRSFFAKPKRFAMVKRHA